MLNQAAPKESAQSKRTHSLSINIRGFVENRNASVGDSAGKLAQVVERYRERIFGELSAMNTIG
jgi:hypothetical protein